MLDDVWIPPYVHWSNLCQLVWIALCALTELVDRRRHNRKGTASRLCGPQMLFAGLIRH